MIVYLVRKSPGHQIIDAFTTKSNAHKRSGDLNATNPIQDGITFYYVETLEVRE